MHIHRGGEALLDPAVGAYIETSLITLVRESHCTGLGTPCPFNFTGVYDFIRIHRIKLDLLPPIR